MKKHWAVSYTLKILIRLGGCPGYSESSLGAQSFCWFCHVAAHLRSDKASTTTLFNDFHVIIMYEGMADNEVSHN